MRHREADMLTLIQVQYPELFCAAWWAISVVPIVAVVGSVIVVVMQVILQGTLSKRTYLFEFGHRKRAEAIEVIFRGAVDTFGPLVGIMEAKRQRLPHPDITDLLMALVDLGKVIDHSRVYFGDKMLRSQLTELTNAAFYCACRLHPHVREDPLMSTRPRPKGAPKNDEEIPSWYLNKVMPQVENLEVAFRKLIQG